MRMFMLLMWLSCFQSLLRRFRPDCVSVYVEDMHVNVEDPQGRFANLKVEPKMAINTVMNHAHMHKHTHTHTYTQTPTHTHTHAQQKTNKEKTAAKPTPAPFSGQRPRALPAERCWGVELTRRHNGRGFVAFSNTLAHHTWVDQQKKPRHPCGQLGPCFNLFETSLKLAQIGPKDLARLYNIEAVLRFSLRLVGPTRKLNKWGLHISCVQ